MAAKNKDDIRYQIDQLRKDKIIYAVESTALSMLALLFLFALVSGALPVLLGNLQVSQTFAESLLKVLLSVPFLYWVYALAGNIMRFRKIRNLEKML